MKAFGSLYGESGRLIAISGIVMFQPTEVLWPTNKKVAISNKVCIRLPICIGREKDPNPDYHNTGQNLICETTDVYIVV